LKTCNNAHERAKLAQAKFPDILSATYVAQINVWPWLCPRWNPHIVGIGIAVGNIVRVYII